MKLPTSFALLAAASLLGLGAAAQQQQSGGSSSNLRKGNSKKGASRFAWSVAARSRQSRVECRPTD